MIEAIIFDMDGLLVDSEPLWRIAEIETFKEIGVTLTEKECELTMGWRTDEVIEFWFQRRPWEGKSVKAVEKALLNQMEELLREQSVAMLGSRELLANFSNKKLPIALASSSPMQLINAVVEKLEIRDFFQFLVSAEHEPFGKPHPGVFLTTAQKLKVDPTRCLVFEDSANGVIAAKAARMKAVAVPAASDLNDPRFGVADLILPSLEKFSSAHWSLFQDDTRV